MNSPFDGTLYPHAQRRDLDEQQNAGATPEEIDSFFDQLGPAGFIPVIAAHDALDNLDFEQGLATASDASSKHTLDELECLLLSEDRADRDRVAVDDVSTLERSSSMLMAPPASPFTLDLVASPPSSPGYDQSPSHSVPPSPSSPHPMQADFYDYTPLPEKGKLIWVTCFFPVEVAIERFILRVVRLPVKGQPNDGRYADPRAIECEVEALESWVVKGRHPNTGERVWQYKLAFELPKGITYRSGFFAAILQHADRSDIRFVLGGLRVVSTTSQREDIRPKLVQLFPNSKHRQLVRNNAQHGPARHYRNGKGSMAKQGARQPAQFKADECKKAVTLTSLF